MVTRKNSSCSPDKGHDLCSGWNLCTLSARCLTSQRLFKGRFRPPHRILNLDLIIHQSAGALAAGLVDVPNMVVAAGVGEEE